MRSDDASFDINSPLLRGVHGRPNKQLEFPTHGHGGLSPFYAPSTPIPMSDRTSSTSFDHRGGNENTRPPASRRRDRFLRRFAHLGAKFAAPSPSALRRPGWRVLARRHAMDRLQAGLLPAGPNALTPVPAIVPGALGESLRRWQAAVLLRLASAERTQRLPALFGAAAKGRVGRLCQATLRQARAGARLRRPIYAPRRHLQQSPRRCRGWHGAFPLEGLSARRSAKGHDRVSRRVHLPLSTARPTRRLPSNPLLRLPRQSLPRTKARLLSRPARHAGSRAIGLPSSEGLSRPLRGAQAMPGLSSRAHDHHRNLRRRHRTTAILGYVVNEARRFHRHAPLDWQTPPVPRRCVPSCPPAPSGRSRSRSSSLSKPESALLSSLRPPAAAASTPTRDAPFLGRAPFNTHRTPLAPAA